MLLNFYIVLLAWTGASIAVIVILSLLCIALFFTFFQLYFIKDSLRKWLSSITPVIPQNKPRVRFNTIDLGSYDEDKFPIEFVLLNPKGEIITGVKGTFKQYPEPIYINNEIFIGNIDFVSDPENDGVHKGIVYIHRKQNGVAMKKATEHKLKNISGYSVNPYYNYNVESSDNSQDPETPATHQEPRRP